MHALLQRRSLVLGIVLPAALQTKFPASASVVRRPATVVYCATSLDGFLARPDGSLDWLPPPPQPIDAGYASNTDDLGFEALQSSVDRIFMGRKTFDVVTAFDGPWPYSKPLTVISSTLKTVPDKLRGKVTFTDEQPLAVLDEMSRAGVKRVYVDGGTLITSLLRKDAIDEMILTTGARAWVRARACVCSRGKQCCACAASIIGCGCLPRIARDARMPSLLRPTLASFEGPLAAWVRSSRAAGRRHPSVWQGQASRGRPQVERRRKPTRRRQRTRANNVPASASVEPGEA